MRILDLHVDGFGKLHGFTYSAKPGMNLILGENEFGKSTLLAFVRAMLYGFGKRSSGRLKDFDRRKYAPWNHSAYGGSMTFSHEGVMYRLERSFATSRAEDETALSVCSTGTRIDLASEEPGSFLFHMDESEFVNTVFIGQLATPMAKSGRDSDALAARLLNLSQSADENISFEEVDRRLLSESIRIKAARGQGGLLPSLLQEQEVNRSMTAGAEAIRDEISSLQSVIKAKKQEESVLQARQTELSDRFSHVKTVTEQVRQQHMEASVLLRTLEEQRDLNIERLAEREREARELKRRQMDVSSRYMEELQALESTIERTRADMEAGRKSFAARVQDLNNRMSKNLLMIRELQQLSSARRADIESREEEVLIANAEIKKTICERDALQKLGIRVSDNLMPSGWVIIPLVVTAIIGFAVLLYLRSPWIFASLLLLIPCIVLFVVNRIQLGRVLQSLALMVRDYEAAVSELHTRKEACLNGEESLRKETQVCEQLKQNLEDIRNRRQGEVLLSRRMLRLSEDRIADLRFGMSQNARGEDSGMQFCRESDDGQAQTPEASAVSEIELFEAKILAGREHLSAVEEMSAQIQSEATSLLAEEKEISAALTEVRVAAARLETARESLLQHVPDESRLEEQGRLIRERIYRLTTRYDAITTAREALNRAYTDMEHDFVPRVNERTAEYFSGLTGQAYSALRVDREFSAELMAAGGNAYKSLDYYSGGTVDQLYFSLRLAIGDLIRQSEESLPLLLDDTFVQYDDKRALIAMRLIQKLAGERQVFLFTCQERMSELYAKVEAAE